MIPQGYGRTDEWPLVLLNDDGIRPGGSPDQCFYCASVVGSPHASSCVCVLSLIRYDVKMDWKVVGIYRSMDPYHWSVHDGEFHKNESSWCADNALDSIEWTDEMARERVMAHISIEDHCSCSLLEFEYHDLIDEGPFIRAPRNPPIPRSGDLA